MAFTIKTQIEGLLANRASYDDIRLLLEDVQVVVSKITVYRFWHQVLGHKAKAIRHRDQPNPFAMTPLKISSPHPTLQAALQEHGKQIPALAVAPQAGATHRRGRFPMPHLLLKIVLASATISAWACSSMVRAEHS